MENATDKKVKEDCIPGKPISVFTSDPHKVCALRYCVVL